MIPVWTFIAVAVPLVLTPGASTAVVLRNSISGGTRAGVETAVGANAGSMAYGLLSAFGLALALQRWPGAWTILRAAGVAYLAWLGVQSLRRAFGNPTMQLPAATEFRGNGSSAGRILRNIRDGFFTNTLNPAIATFYLVIVPQFVPRGAPVARSILLLTCIHIALAGTWHVVWAIAGGTLARTLSSGRPRQLLESIAGIALLALALTLALD